MGFTTGRAFERELDLPAANGGHHHAQADDRIGGDRNDQCGCDASGVCQRRRRTRRRGTRRPWRRSQHGPWRNGPRRTWSCGRIRSRRRRPCCLCATCWDRAHGGGPFARLARPAICVQASICFQAPSLSSPVCVHRRGLRVQCLRQLHHARLDPMGLALDQRLLLRLGRRRRVSRRFAPVEATALGAGPVDRREERDRCAPDDHWPCGPARIGDQHTRSRAKVRP